MPTEKASPKKKNVSSVAATNKVKRAESLRAPSAKASAKPVLKSGSTLNAKPIKTVAPAPKKLPAAAIPAPEKPIKKKAPPVRAGIKTAPEPVELPSVKRPAVKKSAPAAEDPAPKKALPKAAAPVQKPATPTAPIEKEVEKEEREQPVALIKASVTKRRKPAPIAAAEPAPNAAEVASTEPAEVAAPLAALAEEHLDISEHEEATPEHNTAPPETEAAAVAAEPEIELANPAAPTCEKKYAELFGQSQPKGRGVNLQGEALKPEELAAQGWCVMQYPPRTGRLTWVYATCGLAAMRPKGSEQPMGIELVAHWRDRSTLAIQVLTAIASYLLDSGRAFKTGETLSEVEGVKVGLTDVMLKHFIALDPEPAMPPSLDIPGGSVRPVMLLGISDAELESATKVRPELADGRVVLMEALRKGGVFPVTDPRRQCLTRRRDFSRIWETAFRGIREKK